jgi:superfamily I DNA/RNA helicase
MKKIRIAGPPGTGKTTKLVEIYYKHLVEQYSPTDIIVISHTNTAADHIRRKISADESIDVFQKKTGHEIFHRVKQSKASLEENVTTIHKFCKNRVKGKAFLIEDYDILKTLYPLFDKYTLNKKPLKSVQGLVNTHPFFKFKTAAKDNGREILDYYRSLTFEEKEDYQYTAEELIKMQEYYIKFKTNEKINGRTTKIIDFQDMVEDFYNNKEESEKLCKDIKILIVDEAQDSSVIQRKAEEVMSKNVDYFYKAGDPDQAIFEFAGAAPDLFHREFANPEIELEQGYRCPRIINDYCKKIIQDIWEEYNYTRTWKPREENGKIVEGEIFNLSSLTQDPYASELKNRIQNTTEDFIFTYRGGEPREMIHYLMEIGMPIAIPNKEKSKFQFKYPTNDVKNQREFLAFSKGEIKSLTKIKAMFKGMHPQYQLKTIEELESVDSGSYDINWLVDKGFVVPGVKNINDFQKISKVSTIQMKNYIREIVNNNRDLEKKRVFLENIHTIKGKEFDNVVFDFKLTRQENLFSKKRMKFVACSRARKTLWLLKSKTNLTFAGKEDLQ